MRRSEILSGTYKWKGRNLGRVTSPAPTKSPTTTDLAWAAGFLEGEGSFGAKRVDARTEGVSASQVQREPLERLAALFGGTITAQPPGGPTRQPWFRWAITGTRARGVMMTLFTFMSPKRRCQMKLALCPQCGQEACH